MVVQGPTDAAASRFEKAALASPALLVVVVPQTRETPDMAGCFSIPCIATG